MKIKILALALTLLAVDAASAQDHWDLVKCIEFAKKQSLDVQRKTNDMRSAEVQKNTADNSRLPNLSASLSQNMQFGFTTNNTNAFVKQNSAYSEVGISSNAMIYRGGYIKNNISYTEWNLKAANEDINQIANDLSIKVTLAYLQVLYNKELIKTAESSLAQSKSQLDKTEQMVTNGRLSQADLFDAKAQLAKDEYSLTKAESDMKLALLDLAQIMELPSIDNFDVEIPNIDHIRINSDVVLSLSDNNIDGAYSRRPAIKAAEYRLQAGEYYIKMAQSAYYPTVTASASYGTYYLYAFDLSSPYSNMAFGKQFKNQAKEIIGLQVNIPIFSRYESRNNVNLTRIEQDQRKLNMVDAKKTLFKEMQQAYYNAMTAQRNYVSAQKALEASEISFKYMQDKFDAGRSTIFEINEAKKRLTTSQAELSQARYDFIFRTKLLDYYNGTPISL